MSQWTNLPGADERGKVNAEEEDGKCVRGRGATINKAQRHGTYKTTKELINGFRLRSPH